MPHPTHKGHSKTGRPPDAILHSEKLEAGRKTFFLDLKENTHGVFLSVTEKSDARRDRIVINLSDIGAFYEKLCGVMDAVEDKGLASFDNPTTNPNYYADREKKL